MEINDLEFRYELKLQKISIISFATYLWKLPPVKEEISTFFKSNEDSSSRCKNWHQVVEKLSNTVELMVANYVLAHLRLELNDAIVNLGERILHWVIHITEDLKLDYACAEDIYFTYYGVIDENKIFKLSWEKNSVLSFGIPCTQYDRLPCIYAQVDFINQNKCKLVSSLCYPVSLSYSKSKDEVHFLITAGICSFINSTTVVIPTALRTVINKFTRQGVEIKSKDMFQISVAVGFPKAVEYFLHKLDPLTIEKEIPSAVSLCLKKLKTLKQGFFYQKEKYTEVFLNLLNRLAENKRSSFILKNQISILALLLNWPFQNFYIQMLEKTSKNLTKEGCNMLVTRMANRAISDFKSPCGIKRTMYKILLQMTWCRISDDKKAYIHRQYTTVSKLFTHSQFSILRTLINIKNLPDGLKFNQIAVQSRLCTCIKQGKFDKLDEFVKEVFISTDEIEIFKLEMVDCFADIVDADLFKKADMFLDWLASSDKNRQFYKNQIDNLGILRKFVQKRNLRMAERFLRWRFDTEAERKNYKTLLRNDEVIQVEVNKVLKEPDGNEPFRTFLLKWLGEGDPQKEG